VRFRERVGIIDMGSFGKIEITGPGACRFSTRAGNLIDRPVGSVVLTQLLNQAAELSRRDHHPIGKRHFRLVTGAVTSTRPRMATPADARATTRSGASRVRPKTSR